MRRALEKTWLCFSGKRRYVTCFQTGQKPELFKDHPRAACSKSELASTHWTWGSHFREGGVWEHQFLEGSAPATKTFCQPPQHHQPSPTNTRTPRLSFSVSVPHYHSLWEQWAHCTNSSQVPSQSPLHPGNHKVAQVLFQRNS